MSERFKHDTGEFENFKMNSEEPYNSMPQSGIFNGNV